jgi:hypothetical protein
MARVTGLEPAASGVTGRRSNQLSYTRVLVGGKYDMALGLSMVQRKESGQKTITKIFHQTDLFLKRNGRHGGILSKLDVRQSTAPHTEERNVRAADGIAVGG